MRAENSIKILALISDAYGASGGIARFNKDLFGVLSNEKRLSDVVILARSARKEGLSEVPHQLEYRVPRFGGKLAFALWAIWLAITRRPDMILIGHINFCFLGVLISRLAGARSVLIVHGAEVWKPRRSALVNRTIPLVDCIVGVSRLTLDRLSSWARVDAGKFFLLPCCVDLKQFEPGPKPRHLLEKHALAGRRIIMTMGRLAAEERMKGFDEVIELMPRLMEHHPNLAYLICGTGSDEARLRQKAADLGVSDSVFFAGFVPESEKANYYRLADAYVMPSRGEGFGIVILEALASGIPVLASSIDGTGEVLRGGELGLVVDPRDMEAVCRGILKVLDMKQVFGPPAELKDYSLDAFGTRVQKLLTRLIAAKIEKP